MGTLFLAIDGLFLPLQLSLGITSGWFFFAVIFFLLFVLFLILFIRKCMRQSRLEKLIKKKDEYITGLEASLNLPSIRMPEQDEFASIVFDSDKERKREQKAKQHEAAKEVTATVDPNSVIAGRINAQVPTVDVAGAQAPAPGITGAATAQTSPLANSGIQGASSINVSSPSQSGAIASSVHEAIYSALSKSLSEREAAAAAAAIGSTDQFMDAIKTAQQHDAEEAAKLAAQQAAEEEAQQRKAAKEKAEKKQAEAALAACGLDPDDLEAQRILAQILSAKADGEKSKHESSDLSGAIPHI